ncbi:MAG: hypothetical protein P4L56_05015 [Candidatus Sulfopaludibacter sp.]|nr:hypothetical protein [Candidatus Sulfopaludibacter sp.]
MKRTILLGLTYAGMLAAAEQTFTGVITDTMCGKSHDMMAGQPDEKCVAACVKGSSRYALYDGKTVLQLSDQKTPARFAAKRVKVTGTLNEKTQTIKVVSMEAGN